MQILFSIFASILEKNMEKHLEILKKNSTVCKTKWELHILSVFSSSTLLLFFILHTEICFPFISQDIGSYIFTLCRFLYFHMQGYEAAFKLLHQKHFSDLSFMGRILK